MERSHCVEAVSELKEARSRRLALSDRVFVKTPATKTVERREETNG